MKYVLLFIMTFMSAFASFFLKKSTGGDKFYQVLLNYNFYLGGMLYVFATLFNIVLLQFFPFAVIMPLGAFTYIWTMFISKWFLQEKITKKKVLGIVLVITGVVCLGIGQV